MVDVRVGIIGLGSVGQGVVKILSDNISLIQKKTNARAGQPKHKHQPEQKKHSSDEALRRRTWLSRNLSTPQNSST